MKKCLQIPKGAIVWFKVEKYLKYEVAQIIHKVYYYQRNKIYCEKSESEQDIICLLYTSPSPRDQRGSRMPSSA